MRSWSLKSRKPHFYKAFCSETFWCSLWRGPQTIQLFFKIHMNVASSVNDFTAEASMINQRLREEIILCASLWVVEDMKTNRESVADRSHVAYFNSIMIFRKDTKECQRWQQWVSCFLLCLKEVVGFPLPLKSSFQCLLASS